MRSRGQDAPQALPAHFEGLARVIAGRPPVTISTGPTSRAALAAAGHRAATVGRTIHLDRLLDRSERTVEIVAHELVHAARPTAVPRFFGDSHRDDEEIKAERTGTLLRALSTPASLPFQPAAVAAMAGAQPHPAGPLSSTRMTLGTERLPTDRLPVVGPRAFSANVSAPVNVPSPLVPERRDRPIARRVADRALGAAPGQGASRLEQQFYAALSASPALDAAPPRIDRRTAESPTMSQEQTNVPLSPASPAGGELSPETIERIIEAVEQRVIEDLERRGIRHNPGVL